MISNLPCHSYLVVCLADELEASVKFLTLILRQRIFHAEAEVVKDVAALPQVVAHLP